MRRYETIIITDPDMAEDARKTLTDRVGELMAAEGGFLIKQDEWGIRKLAYEIRKKPRGFYTLLDFCGQGALVDEMERQFRIDDRVLKYMTIVLDKEADLESIKAEIAAAQSEAETAAAEGETQAQTAAESPAAESPVAESPVAESPATDASGEKATQVEKAAANADAEPTAKEGVKAQTAETESVEKE
jgi:small subunit ribosomal protein S6